MRAKTTYSQVRQGPELARNADLPQHIYIGSASPRAR